jgi:hypothetical protein
VWFLPVLCFFTLVGCAQRLHHGLFMPEHAVPVWRWLAPLIGRARRCRSGLLRPKFVVPMWRRPMTLPPLRMSIGTRPPPSRHQHFPVCASHHRGRVQEQLHAVRQWPAPPSSRHRRLPVRASHRHGQVRERLCVVWRRSAPLFCLGADACLCSPPTCAGLPVSTSHHRERVRKRLHAVWRLAPLSIQAWTHAGACLPPSCGSPGTAPHSVAEAGTPPFSYKHGRLLMHASHLRGRVQERLCMVWRWPVPLPPSRHGPLFA